MQIRERLTRAKIIEASLLLVLAAGSIGAGIWINHHREKQAVQGVAASVEAPVTWQYDQRAELWRASGDNPPACPEPMLSQSPVDTSLVTGLTYPGQYRQNIYRTVGGFYFANSKPEDIKVTMPMDGTLSSASRYIEKGTTQYLLTFTHPCGVSFRFDRLLTPSPKVQKIMDKLPEAKDGKAEGTFINPPVAFRAGEELATAVGYADHAFMEFGFYDLRVVNMISADPKWKEQHQEFKDTEWHGVCWLDLLPEADKAKAQELMSKDDPKNTISDYCDTPGGTTINPKVL